MQSLVAMTGVVYGIKHMASVGLDWLAPAGIIAGVVAGVLFVRRQLRQATPLLDIRLFKHSIFTGAILINMLSLAFLIGFVFFATQFLQLVLEMPPLRASLALVPGQVLAIIAGMAVVPVARRMPAHALMTLLLAFAGTAFLLTAASTGQQDLLWIIVAFALLNIGVGAITTVSNDLVLAAAPANKAGAASAISETAYEVGTVLGTTVLGGVVTAYYRTSLQLPDFLTSPQTMLAGETLAGAHHVALALSATQGSDLMSSAAQAFQGGMALVSWVTLGLAVMARLIAWRTFRANSLSPKAG